MYTHTHAHVIIVDIQNTQCILLEYMVSLLLCTFPSLSHTASLLPVIDGLNSTTLTSVRSQSRALIRCFKESRAPTCCSTEGNHYSDHWKVCEYHCTCVYISNNIEKLLCNTLFIFSLLARGNPVYAVPERLQVEAVTANVKLEDDRSAVLQ